MNKSVYEKNLEVLEAKYPVWAGVVSGMQQEQRKLQIVSEKSVMGDSIFKVEKDRISRYLNGRYAPMAVVDKWIGEQGKFEPFTTIVIIGIANGQHIRRIMESVPRTVNILIYEPSFEVFSKAMEEVDLSFLFQLDIPVGIIVHELNRGESAVYFQKFLTYDNLAFLKLYISGNYSDLFEEEVTGFVKELNEYVRFVTVGWNTVSRFTAINARNVFANLPYLYEGYSVAELRGILPKNVPVIVVSAGPSLNKNIHELKKAVGKACIIATDTAMKPLLEAGIVPHLFVIVDGLKPASLFQHKDISKSAMVTMTEVSVEPMKIHKGKKFFYYSGSEFENQILRDLSKKENADRTLLNIPTGGSVATSAYSLGINMGSEIIILVGQDLAMTGNRTHADGTFKEKMDEIDTKNGGYIEVESVDGGKVFTRDDFKLYLEWFEKHIKMWDHITTIDATEGGALIRGSKVMTLKEAISKYCKEEFDVQEHIDHSKKIFVGENEEIALKYFANAEKKLMEVNKKAKEGLKQYEKLEKLAGKSIISDSQVQKILKKIKKINNYVEKDYMAETAMDSVKGIEYVLRPLIYDVKEEKKNELLDIARHGQVLLYGLAIASEEIASIAKETVVAYAKEQQERNANEKDNHVRNV